MKKSLNTVLIAGTQVGVGKTMLRSVLAAYLAAYYPACDRTSLHLTDDSYPDGYPGTGLPSTDLAALWQTVSTCQAQHDLVLLEAPGSLGSPLTPEVTVADLAWDWRLPTVLVVPLSADVLGQAIAHVALARQSRVFLKGLVVNTPQPFSGSNLEDAVLIQNLRSLTQVPVLGKIPYLEAGDDAKTLAAVGSNLNIEGLLPLPTHRFYAAAKP
ncbi:MAG: AAA family ATPase [Synechococcales bacterium]|nr:AAA family ATPase [Synechococcales bacterium]